MAVVLAAGAGRRFSGPGHKLLARWRDRPVVVWAVEAAVASGLDTVVVHGAVDLTDLAAGCGARAVANPRWAEGQATTLQVGLGAAAAAGHDAVVVGLGDQPGVDAGAWSAVGAAMGHGPPIAVATYAGLRGNPVGLAADVWPLLPVEGDEGARSLMRRRPDLVAEVACPGDPTDIDTVEDLQRWS